MPKKDAGHTPKKESEILKWIPLLVSLFSIGDVAAAIYAIIKIREYVEWTLTNESALTTTAIEAIIGCSICLLSLVGNIVVAIFIIRHNKCRDGERDNSNAAECDDSDRDDSNKFLPIPHHPDYTVSKSTFELYFKERQDIISTDNIEFTVSANHLYGIPIPFWWTGDIYVKSELDEDSLKKGYKLEEEEEEEEERFPRNIMIKFPKKKTKGETDHYVLKTYVKDTKKSMTPVLSRLVKCQTENLILRVVAPSGLIESAKGRRSIDIFREDIIPEPPKLIAPKKIAGSELCVYEWPVDKPVTLLNYFIEFEFCNSEK